MFYSIQHEILSRVVLHLYVCVMCLICVEDACALDTGRLTGAATKLKWEITAPTSDTFPLNTQRTTHVSTVKHEILATLNFRDLTKNT